VGGKLGEGEGNTEGLALGEGLGIKLGMADGVKVSGT